MIRRRRAVLAGAFLLLAAASSHAFGQARGSGLPDSKTRLERSVTPSPGTTSDTPRGALPDPAVRRPTPDLRERIVVPPAVTVPDLKGRTVQDARQLLERARLNLSVGDRRPGGGDTDTVVGQKPPAGERVGPGTTVTVSVALAAPRVIVPELRGRPVFEAERLVARLGLRLSIAGRPPGDGQSDSVVEQKPSPGTPSAPGATVTVVVRAPGGSVPGATSDGPAQPDPAPRVTVPDVTGRTVDVAAQILARSGLRVEVARERPEGGAAGTITEQKPRAGDRVSPGATVAVTVVTPPRLVVVPDIRGLLLPDAERLVARSRLQLSVTDRRLGDGRANSVADQKPAAGTEVKPGSTVSVVVLILQGDDGGGTRDLTPPVVVPDVRGRTLEVAARLLEQSRLRLDVAGRRQESGGDGTIAEQQPLPGDRAVAGSAVSVIVVTAPPLVTVPDVRGHKLAEAERILRRTRLGLTVAERRPGDGPPESVVDQRPPAGSRVEPGSTVRLAVVIPAAAPPTAPPGGGREPGGPPVVTPPPARVDPPVATTPPVRVDPPSVMPPPTRVDPPAVTTPPIRVDSPPPPPARVDPPVAAAPGADPPRGERADQPAAIQDPRPTETPGPPGRDMTVSAPDPAPIAVSSAEREGDVEPIAKRIPLHLVITATLALLVGAAAGVGLMRWRANRLHMPTAPSLRVVTARDLGTPELSAAGGLGSGLDIRLRGYSDPGQQTLSVMDGIAGVGEQRVHG